MNIDHKIIVIFCYLLAIQYSKATADDKPRVILQSRIDIDERGLRVPVSVNGKIVNFLVSTVHQYTMIDSKLAETLPVVKESKIADETKKKIDIRHVSSLEIIGTEFGKIANKAGNDVVAVDTTGMCFGDGVKENYGVLGLDILSKYTLSFNFDEKRLQFIAPTLDETKWPNYTAIPFRISDHCPVAKFKTSGSPFECAISTAEPVTFRILKDSYDSALSDGLITTKRAKGINKMDAAITCFPNLSLGEFSHSVQTVQPVESDSASIVGLYYLRRYNFVLDFSKSSMHVQKSAYFDLPFIENAGVFFHGEMRTDKIVQYVVEESDAEKIGLQSGDELIRVGPYDAFEESSRLLGAHLNLRLKAIDISYKRNGELRTVTMPKSENGASISP